MHPDKSQNHRGELLEVPLITSGQESNKINTKETYGHTSLKASKMPQKTSGDPKAYFRQDSLHNEMTERTYGKTTVQPRVTELNKTLMQQLTFESNTGLAGKESKQFSSTSGVNRRQHGSERVAGAPEATASRVGTIGGAQPPRLAYQPEHTTIEALRKSRFIAADLKDNNAAKTESTGSSPVPSRRTSEQKDQTPGASSENDLHLPACDLCGLQGIIMCSNCIKIVCETCMKIYTTDLCGATKGQHKFVTFKASKMPQKTSGGTKAYFSQESANTNEASENGNKNWACIRCTFLNPPEHRICIMCGASRGIYLAL